MCRIYMGEREDGDREMREPGDQKEFDEGNRGF